MILRGSIPRAFATCIALVLVLTPMSIASAAKKPIITSNENSSTLTVSLPGPLNGCGYLDAGSNATSRAVLDLIQPSAFLTSTANISVGAGGPISSAELTSLSPETVVYTIAQGYTWSNGEVFNGYDLVTWWSYAKKLPSITSDGYRDIKSLEVDAAGKTVTAVFSSPYAAWTTLFRDIVPAGFNTGCSLNSLLTRPTLGPYSVSSVSPTRIVLVMNKKWKLNPNRFGRVIITTSTDLPNSSTANYASYSIQVTKAASMALSAHRELVGHIGTSDQLAELVFAPRTAITTNISVREALSIAIQRQPILNSLWGSVTFSPAPATSMLLTQGQNGYPGGAGPGPTISSTTTSQVNTTTSLVPTSMGNTVGDCLECAQNMLTGSTGFKLINGQLRNSLGNQVTVRLLVGPTNLEKTTARLISDQWKKLGIAVYQSFATSELSVASQVSLNRYDVGILMKTSTNTPSTLARSFYGPAFMDSYPSGVRTALLNKLFTTAISNFNPVSALKIWSTFDQTVLGQFWVRPLFTLPTFTSWSNRLSNVTGSLSVQGFVDQIPIWGTETAAPAN